MNASNILRKIHLISSIKNKIINFLILKIFKIKISIDYRGIKIFHPEKIFIGDLFSAGRGLWLESVNGEGTLYIGDRVNLSDNVHIGAANLVKIGSDVLVGSGVLITDHSHGKIGETGPEEASTPPNNRSIFSKGPVVIEEKVWIGDGVRVMPNVRIGTGSIIGANTVVLKDIPPNTIWGGIPARQIWP